MPKKIPLRQCLGCREMKPKRELIRVVRSPQGEISLDFDGKKPGRGRLCLPRARHCLQADPQSREPWNGPLTCPFPTRCTTPLPQEMEGGGLDGISIPVPAGPCAARQGGLPWARSLLRTALPVPQGAPAAAGQRRGGQHHPSGPSFQPSRKNHLSHPPPDQGGAGQRPGPHELRHGRRDGRGLCRVHRRAPGPGRARRPTAKPGRP